MKKILSFILVLCFIFSMNVCAFATDEGTPPEEPTTESDGGGGESEGTDTPTVGNGTGGTETVDFSLDDAVTAVGQTGTVKVNADLEVSDVTTEGSVDTDGAKIQSGSDITIDLNGEDVVFVEDPSGSTGTTTLGVQVLKDSKVTITNGSMSFDNDALENEELEKNFKMGIQNYGDLTLEDVSIDGTGLDTYDPTTESNVPRTTVNVNNGSLTVNEGTEIIAKEGAYAVSSNLYSQYYQDGADVTIGAEDLEDDEIHIVGSVKLDSDATLEEAEGAPNTDEDDHKLPTLTILSGVFDKFKLVITSTLLDPAPVDDDQTDDPAAVSTGDETTDEEAAPEETASPIDTLKSLITIKGGSFSSKDVVLEGGAEISDGKGGIVTIENFVDTSTLAVVYTGGYYKVMTIAEANALNAPVVAVVPSGSSYTPPASQVTTVVQNDGEAVTVNLSSATVASRPVNPVKLEDNAPAELEVVVDRGAINANKNKADEIVEIMANDIIVKGADGETIDAADYEVVYDGYGSLIIKLSPELLAKLGEGKHVFTVTFGGIEVEFKVIIK